MGVIRGSIRGMRKGCCGDWVWGRNTGRMKPGLSKEVEFSEKSLRFEFDKKENTREKYHLILSRLRFPKPES